MVDKNNKNLIIGILVILAILILLGSFGFRSYGMMGGFGSGLGWIFNILIIVLIVVGIYWLIKHINLKR